MTTESMEAWVLHKAPSGDTSVRVIFFTREKGILNCLYKGGRKPEKQALLEPFTPLWLALDVRRDWYFVRKVEILTDKSELKGASVFAGFYLNELLYSSLKPMDSQPELYDSYSSTLKGLAGINEPLSLEILLRHFEHRLLAACGYGVSFTHTAEPGTPILADHRYRYVAGQGFVRGETGIQGSNILAIAEGRFQALDVLKTAKLIMRQAIDHLLEGRELKSRSLYKNWHVNRL